MQTLAGNANYLRGHRAKSVYRRFTINDLMRQKQCSRNIEMTPLCKIEVTLARFLGSREVRRGGGVDEQAGVQPP
jgi:hypothetical protein